MRKHVLVFVSTSILDRRLGDRWLNKTFCVYILCAQKVFSFWKIQREDNGWVCIKNYKIVCILLIIFVFFSGMCFEGVKTDSTFACTPIEASNVYSLSGDIVSEDVEFCTTEMLGIRNHISIQQLTEQDIPRGVVKMSLVLFCSYLFLISVRKFSSSSEMVQFWRKHQEEVVLNYIHKSDGKKRI